MFQSLLDEKLDSELGRLKNMQQSDLNAQRLVDSFTAHFRNSLSELREIEDPELLLQNAIDLLNRVPKMLVDLAAEVSVTRRELTARVNAISECRNVLVEKAEAQAREDQRVEKLANKIKNGEDVKSRKPGERPAKLKEARKAQELVNEEETAKEGAKISTKEEKEE